MCWQKVKQAGRRWEHWVWKGEPAKLQFMVWAPYALGSGLWAPGLWAPWALGSGQDVLGSRVYWAPEITGLPGLPNRNLLSVFEAVKDLLNRKQI